MLKLLVIGLLSALFFSSTFILNRSMSLDGGHWVWSGALRYLWMITILVSILFITRGKDSLFEVFKVFINNYIFWLIAGTTGFGFFYALNCFSADFSPGWVIATTWQLTIIMSLFVLSIFGRRFPKKVWLFSIIIFSGVVLVNLSEIRNSDIRTLLFGSIPVLIAAFCYPFGNQLIWESKRGRSWLPKIDSPVLDNAFNKVLLMSLGSLPFWILLVILTGPKVPSNGQIVSTLIVAVFSGIIATTLFLFARGKAENATEIAAVDATQSFEVIFAMIGEIILLNSTIPSIKSFFGIIVVFAGLSLYLFAGGEKK